MKVKHVYGSTPEKALSAFNKIKGGTQIFLQMVAIPTRDKKDWMVIYS